MLGRDNSLITGTSDATAVYNRPSTPTMPRRTDMPSSSTKLRLTRIMPAAGHQPCAATPDAIFHRLVGTQNYTFRRRDYTFIIYSRDYFRAPAKITARHTQGTQWHVQYVVRLAVVYSCVCTLDGVWSHAFFFLVNVPTTQCISGHPRGCYVSPLWPVVWLGRTLTVRPGSQSSLDVSCQHPRVSGGFIFGWGGNFTKTTIILCAGVCLHSMFYITGGVAYRLSAMCACGVCVLSRVPVAF